MGEWRHLADEGGGGNCPRPYSVHDLMIPWKAFGWNGGRRKEEGVKEQSRWIGTSTTDSSMEEEEEGPEMRPSRRTSLIRFITKRRVRAVNKSSRCQLLPRPADLASLTPMSSRNMKSKE